jgi:hypothetical protein
MLGGAMRDDGRRARIVAAVSESGPMGVAELTLRICRLFVDAMTLSGCALVLMSGTESLTALAGAGRRASTIPELQFALGEGPCLDAYTSGAPVLLSDLTAEGAIRWPVFAEAAVEAGVRAEFSLPLSVGPSSIGAFDLCRDEPGMLSDEHLADALVAADIARDALLYLQEPPHHADLAELLETTSADRFVVHQATGMIAVQLDETPSNALARLRASAFQSGRSVYDIAQDVVGRRVRFDE